MGYLTVKGKLMTYSEYKHLIEQYKKHGLNQFLKIHEAHKDKQIDENKLHWGEEIEYSLFVFDQEEKHIMLYNDALRLIEEFNEEHKEEEIVLQPEFGNWMVEAVPSLPYSNLENIQDLLSCYPKISQRRKILEEFFSQKGLAFTSMASPPILGTNNHILIQDPILLEKLRKNDGNLEKINEFSKSKFVIDGTENPHPRFPGLMKSIRERRGEKVKILIPIYQDKNTNMTVPTYDEPYPGQIYMDAMHFGMGSSCLQVTFEAQTINAARFLHDMLLPFTPIMAALSQSAPIYKGKLSDNDLRWTVISQSVDCRTEDERNPNSVNFVPKSRYSSINHYISNHEYIKDKYNDAIPYKVNPAHVEQLKQGGLDERLAFHIASLFVRDPVPSYSNEHDESQIDDNETQAHFENLQSTNWNSMRFKPPPSKDSSIGWRVEFRTMDIQLTDFENSALIVLLGMICNIINHFDVDFSMPITLIDENMDRAHMRDGLLTQKFWFKTSNLPSCVSYKKNSLQEEDFLRSHKCPSDTNSSSSLDSSMECEPDQFHELYVHEILTGKEEIGFKGIYPLIEEFMAEYNYNIDHVSQVRTFLSFLLERASGGVKTGARYIRDFVLDHPDYKQDSIVDNKISYDLIESIVNMKKNPTARANLLGRKWAKY